MGATHFSGPLFVADTEIVDSSGNVIADVQIGNLEEILDGNSNEILEFATTAAAVNHAIVTNAATGNAPTLGAVGDDANIDLNIAAAGTGDVRISSGSLFVDSGATNLNLIDSAGTGVIVASGAQLNVGNGAGAETLKISAGAAATLEFGGTSAEIAISSGAATVIDIQNPVVESSTQSVGAADEAIDVVSSITEISSDADGTAHALADGTEGQHKYLVMISDGGGNAVVTPTNFGQGATLTFADVGDSCHLLFTNGSWYIVGNQGVAVA